MSIVIAVDYAGCNLRLIISLFRARFNLFCASVPLFFGWEFLFLFTLSLIFVIMNQIAAFRDVLFV